MEFFNVVSIEEGQRLLDHHMEDFKLSAEVVSLDKAFSRILAENIYSNINVPEFDRSTVDGYAIRAVDSHGASDSVPSVLDLIGHIDMGQATDLLIKPGQAAYIPTGGMLPEGADGAVMVENCEKLDDKTLMVYKAISQGENLVYKADDIEKDSLVLKKGSRLTSENIGVLAALGIKEVKVFKKPSFYIISTGDEIIDIDEELRLGKIRDINSYTLAAEIEKLGGQLVGKAIVGDDYDLLRNQVEKGLQVADIILLSGGSSVGTRDYSHKVLNSFGGAGVFVHGVAIRPGKPTIMAEAKGKLLMGLPGHPVSSLLVFKTFVVDFIKAKMGLNEITPTVRARMDYNFPSSPGRTSYHMVQLRKDGDNYLATPSFGQSAMISLMSKSDGYIVLQSHEEGTYKGQEREVFLL